MSEIVSCGVGSVSVVVLNYRCSQLTIDCVASVIQEIQQSQREIRVVVVDGGSADGSSDHIAAAIRSNGWASSVRLVSLNENRGFSFGNNAAIAEILGDGSNPEFILLLNPDTVVLPGAIERLSVFLQSHPSVGICGSRLEYPDGSTQFAARRFPSVCSEFESTVRLGLVSKFLRKFSIVEPESDVCHSTDWLPGASLLIRREVFDKVGLLDDGYFMYFEEVDFCWRAKRSGWEVWYVPDSRVIHYVGQSSGVTSVGLKKRRPGYWFDSRRRYFQKNHGLFYRILADCAYVLGMSLFKLRQLIWRKSIDDPPFLLRDFLQHAFRYGA